MMRLSVLLLCFLPALAASDGARLGRLFLTPAERASLDIVRQNSKPPEKLVQAGETENDKKDFTPVTTEALPVVTIHGYVRRSDGKGTVWVNGMPVQEKSTEQGFEVGRLQGNTNQVQIKLPGTGKTVSIKAGQSYDPASGKVGSLREIAPVSESAPAEPAAKAQEKPSTTSTKVAPSSDKISTGDATVPTAIPSK